MSASAATRIVCLAVLLAIPSAGLAEIIPDAACADCHDNTPASPGEVAPFSLIGSIHEGLSCTDCHSGIVEVPHEAEVTGPHCGNCHEDIVTQYKRHGRGVVGGPVNVPLCHACHGSHQILPQGDPNSKVHHSNLPATCGVCHENQEFVDQENIRFKHPVEIYNEGVHGRRTADNGTAATCSDCHSTGGSTHRILPPGDIESTINFFNIAQTCGRCHKEIKKEFDTGIHGELVARGEVNAPTCTHCHGEHGILPTTDPRSPVSAARIAEATCSPCHASASLNERHDVPTGRLKSYVDSYHGLKSSGGDKTVANCASCHGAHAILPSSDPRSSVAPGNLVATCGHCHTGMSSDKAATTTIHAPEVEKHTGWPYYVKVIYISLIVMVIGGMAAYCLLDYIRQVARALGKRQVRRMERNEVIQHSLLAISFTVLVITGFSLRHYDAWWAKLIFGREGGAQGRGLVHRISAVLMVAGAIWHTWYLFTAKGRVFLRDIAPDLEDAKQAWGMVQYNLGKRRQAPAMRRFSFVEKAEYWALIWGTVVMVLTGLVLWLERVLAPHLGHTVLEVFLIIHYYEAWLAFLAILIWHMYGVIFNPHVYPMNPSWITGTMPEEMFKHEHAGAPLPGEPDRTKE